MIKTLLEEQKFPQQKGTPCSGCPQECKLKQLMEELLHCMEKHSDELPALSQWMDSQEVSQALHIGARTLQTLRSNGTLKYTRFGKKIFYKREDIQAVLNNNYLSYQLAEKGRLSNEKINKKI